MQHHDQQQQQQQQDPEDAIPILQPDRISHSPTCVIVVGMAGSGKTTLMAQLHRSLEDGAEDALMGEAVGGAGADDGAASSSSRDDAAVDGDGDAAVGRTDADADDAGVGERRQQEQEQTLQEQKSERKSKSKQPTGYLLNLDPATKMVPYGASIDIRDTVDYHQVMMQHKLGPNGAILTCLNLFATRFDQVMAILERRAFGDDTTTTTTMTSSGGGGASSTSTAENDSSGRKTNASTIVKNKNENNNCKKLLDYILVDTPGQIESFSWSASGQIFSEALASAFPTVLAYVVDTPRCAASPNTFMSNMLYACSMMYRTRLPLVVVFNKTDVVGSEFAQEWMTDYEAFQEALDEFTSSGGGNDSATSGYYASLTRSLSLVLDEFYSVLQHCGVSAATGDGVDDFWAAVDRAAEDFEADYVADLQDRVDERKARRRAKARRDVEKLQRDMGSAKIDD